MHSFLDDVRNMRANAMVILGVIFFALVIAYHSDRILAGEPKGRGRGQTKVHSSTAVPMLKKEIKDIEQITAHLLQHHQGVSSAAEQAKAALKKQSIVRKSFKAAAVFVFRNPGINLHLAIRNVAKRDYIKEIILVHDASHDDFKAWEDRPKEVYGKTVRYVTEKKNLNQLHKYYACSKYADARVNTCYYQAANRDTHAYMDTLWASFLRTPELVHTAVGATTLYSDLLLSIRIDSAGIDAGFAYLNNGAFFLRSHANAFLNKLAEKKDQIKPMSVARAADAYFTFWLNRPHCELANDIVPYKRQIDEPIVYERNAFERRSLQKEDNILAIKMLLQDSLHMQLTTARKNTTFTRPDSYSSCVKDDCLLITNVMPFDPPISIRFNLPMMVTRVASVLAKTLPTQECDDFKAHQYYFAVDDNPDSFWMSDNVTEGDYYGLDLLRLHKNVKTVKVIAAHSFQQSMVIEASMGGVKWYPVLATPHVSKMKTWREEAVYSYTYDLSEALAEAWKHVLEKPNSQSSGILTPPLYIRYLRFRTLKDQGAPFVVFDISFTVGDPHDGLTLAPPRSAMEAALLPSKESAEGQGERIEEEGGDGHAQGELHKMATRARDHESLTGRLQRQEEKTTGAAGAAGAAGDSEERNQALVAMARRGRESSLPAASGSRGEEAAVGVRSRAAATEGVVQSLRSMGARQQQPSTRMAEGGSATAGASARLSAGLSSGARGAGAEAAAAAASAAAATGAGAGAGAGAARAGAGAAAVVGAGARAGAAELEAAEGHIKNRASRAAGLAAERESEQAEASTQRGGKGTGERKSRAH